MGEKEQVERLRRSVQEWNEWLSFNRNVVIDLSKANFSGVEVEKED